MRSALPSRQGAEIFFMKFKQSQFIFCRQFENGGKAIVEGVFFGLGERTSLERGHGACKHVCFQSVGRGEFFPAQFVKQGERVRKLGRLFGAFFLFKTAYLGRYILAHKVCRERFPAEFFIDPLLAGRRLFSSYGFGNKEQKPQKRRKQGEEPA